MVQEPTSNIDTSPETEISAQQESPFEGLENSPVLTRDISLLRTAKLKEQGDGSSADGSNFVGELIELPDISSIASILEQINQLEDERFGTRDCKVNHDQLMRDTLESDNLYTVSLEQLRNEEIKITQLLNSDREHLKSEAVDLMFNLRLTKAKVLCNNATRCLAFNMLNIFERDLNRSIKILKETLQIPLLSRLQQQELRQKIRRLKEYRDRVLRGEIDLEGGF